MNERIYKLMVESDCVSLNFVNNNLEKFAKLIIQECLNICEEMGDNGKDGHYCADKIAKTFLR
jgi:hypothetical protein